MNINIYIWIRSAFTVFLLWHVNKEAGIFTAISLALIFLTTEFVTAYIRHTKKRLNEVLTRLEGIGK